MKTTLIIIGVPEKNLLCECGIIIQEVSHVQKAVFSPSLARLCGFITVLILAFLAVISPQQLPVIAYKSALVSFAACIGVWIDRAIFPMLGRRAT